MKNFVMIIIGVVFGVMISQAYVYADNWYKDYKGFEACRESNNVFYCKKEITYMIDLEHAKNKVAQN